MTVAVLLFAALKDAVGRDCISVRIDAPNDKVNSSELIAACSLQYPELAVWLPHVRIAVNREYRNDALIAQGDEVALLPPVSGGS